MIYVSIYLAVNFIFCDVIAPDAHAHGHAAI
jgi:hypothetical protein